MKTETVEAIATRIAQLELQETHLGSTGKMHRQIHKPSVAPMLGVGCIKRGWREYHCWPKNVNRPLIFALLLLSSGCTTRLHYDYFEPSGLDSVVSMPPQAPKNVATFAWDGCDLQVRAEVTKEERIILTLRAFLPAGTRASFSSDRAELLVSDKKEEVKLSWQEWTLSDGIGARREIAFHAPLKPQSFARTPTRKGTEDMGRYETTVTLPDQYSSVREFTFVLPAPVGYSPLRLRFVRKTADYRVWIPLQ